MTDTIHTCSYFCDRPDCIKAQRDELREALTPGQPVQAAPKVWAYSTEDGERIVPAKTHEDAMRDGGAMASSLLPYTVPLTTLREALAAPVVPEPTPWHKGAPPFPQDQEWFIAETVYGDRVVLRSLDEGREHRGNYAFTTADGTHMKVEIVRRWMQFPDCEYLPPQDAAPTVPPGYALVPLEPTPEMLEAARTACEGRWYVQDMLLEARAMMEDRWSAMLAAAEIGKETHDNNT